MSEIDRFAWARAARRDKELPPRAKLVAQVIAEYFNGKRAFPSQERIAEDTGQSLSSVKRGIRELQGELQGGRRGRQWLMARRRGFAKGYDYTLSPIPLTPERNGDHSAHASAPIPLTPEHSFRPPVNGDQYTEQTTYQEKALEKGENLRGRCPSSARGVLAQAEEALSSNWPVSDSLRIDLEDVILQLPSGDPDRHWADQLHRRVIERLSEAA